MSSQVGGKLQFIGTVEESSASQSENVTSTSETVTCKTSISAQQNWNLEYFKSRNGILKLVEMIIGILCMACLPANPYVSNRSMLVAVAAVFFIFNVIWSVVHALNIQRFASNLPVKTLDFSYCCLATTCYAIISVIHLALINKKLDKFVLEQFGHYASYVVAGVFGMVNAGVYATDTFLLYRQMHTVS